MLVPSEYSNYPVVLATLSKTIKNVLGLTKMDAYAASGLIKWFFKYKFIFKNKLYRRLSPKEVFLRGRDIT